MISIDCDFRIIQSDLNFPHTLVKHYFAHALSSFVIEIVKMNGQEYPPQTLYQMVICIQIYLESEKLYWKLLDKGDPQFVNLYYTLDNIMKAHTAQGLGVKQSASVVSKASEEIMWEKGILGEDNPTQLLDTILYLLGINYALHGGEEHKCLHRPGFKSQLEIGVDSEGVKCLIFTEDPKHKINQGTLDNQYCPPHVVHIYEAKDANCCPVRLFKKYTGLLPKGGMKPDFYLHPLTHYTQHQWYAERPIGLNTLRVTVKHMANEASLPSKFMNHSLRATAATCLYQEGIPEKLIKEITGHRSKAVCDYEYTGVKNEMLC